MHSVSDERMRWTTRTHCMRNDEEAGPGLKSGSDEITVFIPYRVQQRHNTVHKAREEKRKTRDET